MAAQDATHEAELSIELPIRWITLAWYCILTGDTPDAVHARRRKKQWIDGVHCQVDPNGNLRINPKEYNKWVEQGKKSGK